MGRGWYEELGEESRMTSGDAAWVRVLYFPEWGFISRWDKGNTVKFLSDRGGGVCGMLGELASVVHGPMGGLDSHQSHWSVLGSFRP